MEAPRSTWPTLAEVVPRKARWVDGAKPSVKCKWLFNHMNANPRASSQELAVFVLIQKAGSSEFLKGALALRGEPGNLLISHGLHLFIIDPTALAASPEQKAHCGADYLKIDIEDFRLA